VVAVVLGGHPASQKLKAEFPNEFRERASLAREVLASSFPKFPQQARVLSNQVVLEGVAEIFDRFFGADKLLEEFSWRQGGLWHRYSYCNYSGLGRMRQGIEPKGQE
jgi:hypothetical protein